MKVNVPQSSPTASPRKSALNRLWCALLRGRSAMKVVMLALVRGPAGWVHIDNGVRLGDGKRGNRNYIRRHLRPHGRAAIQAVIIETLADIDTTTYEVNEIP